MSRYPTDSRGLALPIQEIGYEVMDFERRKTSRHHLYFYRRDYNDTRIGSVFRGLLPHVQTMRIADHAELHDRYEPPKQPKQRLMIDVIEEYLSLNGIIDVVNENRTCETYQITAEQWGRMLMRNEATEVGR